MINIQDECLLNDTPFIAVDLDRLESNIHRVAELAHEAKVKLRPHTKTHKSPYIAHLQLQAGAQGITTAKLGEAEVMADAGVEDILVAYPIIGRAKLERFSKLLQRINLTVALDDILVAQGINDVGETLKRKINVYIDVDTGLHRMGRNPKSSVDTILKIAKLPYIEVRGLMSHAGHAYTTPHLENIESIAIEDGLLLYEVQSMMERHGVCIPEISVGATATARFIKRVPHVTEMRPGMYVFNDRTVIGSGAASMNDCAAVVVATIVSRPEKNRMIIDAGSKTLSNDAYGRGEGYGVIIDHPELLIKKLSEEHGTIDVIGDCELCIGDTIQIIPNHICPVINLTDRVFGFRRGKVEQIIEVLGRGKNR